METYEQMLERHKKEIEKISEQHKNEIESYNIIRTKASRQGAFRLSVGKNESEIRLCTPDNNSEILHHLIKNVKEGDIIQIKFLGGK